MRLVDTINVRWRFLMGSRAPVDCIDAVRASRVELMDASEYHRIAKSEHDHWWYRSTRQLAKELLADALVPGIVCLDIGAGPGGNGDWLHSYGTVIALDIEPIALAYVQSQHRELVPVLGSATALPIANASIDVVLALTVLYHLDDDEAAFGEIARVLRPGGRALVLEPAFPVLHREHDIVTHGVRRYRRGDLNRLALHAGLDVTRSTYAKSFLFVPAALIAVIQRLVGGHKQAVSPRSDLEPRRFEALLGPIASFVSRLENAWLRRRGVAFGTSVLVVVRRP